MGSVGEESNANRALNEYGYIGDGNPGRIGGGTYTAPNDERRDPTIQDYENIFGPAARDIKLDLQRNKRHSRWHLPDQLRGTNPWLADKIDGLVTDTSASPFTSRILPYYYIENVDQKIKWNRWSFDEGLASRVPYESAARTLTQTKTSYAGYTIRQGLAITMEHNFMVSAKGRENFKNQLQQVVSSIQYTNDIDVTIALITAPSFAKERAEKYLTHSKTNHQIVREYVDLFGFMQKNNNAMDIMIEDAKNTIQTWGGEMPDFVLLNSRLTFQMQMTPEATNYISQGPEGAKRLRQGPNLNSYRGLSVINSRSFAMETGATPRDVLRRRVRVGEYYRIPWENGVENRVFEFYDESKDAWQRFKWGDLFKMAQRPETDDQDDDTGENMKKISHIYTKLPGDAGYAGRAAVGTPSVPAAGYGGTKGTLNFGISKGYWDNVMRAENWTSGALQAFLNRSKNSDFVGSFMGGEQTYTIKQFQEADFRKLWEDSTTPLDFASNDAIQMQYKDYILKDLQDFLVGRTNFMDPKKVEFFQTLGFYEPPTTSYGNSGGSTTLSKFFDALFTPKTSIPVDIQETPKAKYELVVVRPCIEHSMLGIIMGRGGVDPLGATLWGQTELSVYDDSMHGIWGMSYKYNERAIVFNHKNLIRLWDVAYDGYQGGKDCTCVEWTDEFSLEKFKTDVYELNRPYEGASMMVMRFRDIESSEPWPSPIVFHDPLYANGNTTTYLDGEHQHRIKRDPFRVFNRTAYASQYKPYYDLMPDFTRIHNPKTAGTASEENEATGTALAFQGTMQVYSGEGQALYTVTGNGHHGCDRVGIASIRAGKGTQMGSVVDASIVRQL